MLNINTFNTVSRPNVDRENGRLNNVVIMTTDVNFNQNANFTRQNQEEIVLLGSSEKTYCFYGHAKDGVFSAERLPWRLGKFENFRIDETKVRADLVLSPTLDTNPLLQKIYPQGISEYLYSLAENEAEECGFSMAVKLKRNSEDPNQVTIEKLYSVDLVAEPALVETGMFSKQDETLAHEKLTPAIDTFSLLDAALKDGEDIVDPVNTLIAQLQELLATPEPEEEPQVEVNIEVNVNSEPEKEPSLEVEPEPEEPQPTIADLSNRLDDLQNMLGELVVAMTSFSKKEEPKIEEPEVQPLIYNVLPAIKPEESEESYSVTEYNRLKASGDRAGATRYFNKFHK